MAKILIVEDDQEFAENLKDYLAKHHHVVDHASTIEESLGFSQTFRYDILILDWELPDGSGALLCRRLKQAGIASPIIMLTARQTVADRITGLDYGADDYLTKPFYPEELVARLRVLLRRPPEQKQLLELGNITIDYLARAIVFRDKQIQLSNTEFAIFDLVARQSGNSIGTESIVARLSAVHPRLSRSSLKVFVSNIRKRFDQSGETCPLVWQDNGYRLTCD